MRKARVFLACPEGLEPPTCCLEGSCSIQLSYGQAEPQSQAPLPRGACKDKKGPQGGPFCFSMMVGAAGFELATLCSQSRCATRLRYAPTKLRIIAIKKCCSVARRAISLFSAFFVRDAAKQHLACSVADHALALPVVLLGLAWFQQPRVMGMSTSVFTSMCLASSSLAMDWRWTSSGPSARRRVRWLA